MSNYPLFISTSTSHLTSSRSCVWATIRDCQTHVSEAPPQEALAFCFLLSFPLEYCAKVMFPLPEELSYRKLCKPNANIALAFRDLLSMCLAQVFGAECYANAKVSYSCSTEKPASQKGGPIHKMFILALIYL